MRADDGVVAALGPNDAFGEEDLLGGGRRAHRAEAVTDHVLLLRISPELYNKYLYPLHWPSFEDKVTAAGAVCVCVYVSACVRVCARAYACVCRCTLCQHA